MLKMQFTEETMETISILSVKVQRNALMCASCHKDTGALLIEKNIITCGSCKALMRKDACKAMNDVALTVESGMIVSSQ